METVRTGVEHPQQELDRELCCSDSTASRPGRRPALTGVLLLDIVYVIGILAVFALVALVARGVEKL